MLIGFQTTLEHKVLQSNLEELGCKYNHLYFSEQLTLYEIEEQKRMLERKEYNDNRAIMRGLVQTERECL